MQNHEIPLDYSAKKYTVLLAFFILSMRYEISYAYYGGSSFSAKTILHLSLQSKWANMLLS